jgi:indole-3-glycerol phosphate synthase
MDFGTWVARRHREAKSTAPLDGRLVTPSLRDFGAALRNGCVDLVGIPTVSPADERTALEVARQAIASEVVTVAIAVDPEFGGSLAAMRAMSERLPSTPLFLLDPLVAEGQVFTSRLAGADAVTLPVGFLDDGELRRLAQAVRSTMMTPVFVVRSMTEWESASRAGARFLLVAAPDGALAEALELARQLPPKLSLCLWAEGLESLLAVRTLVGRADGALLGPAYPASAWSQVAVLEAER